jgi:H+-translocating NAD(P) transhydrogenase subunit alpha
MNGLILLEVYVFVLACFAGYQLIAKVPPTLHTPLMSGANAISGITVLGAIVVAQQSEARGFGFGTALGFLAVALAAVNVVGGFLVTERMLKMFKSKG